MRPILTTILTCTVALGASEGATALAERVAEAAGIEHWAEVQRLRFTWSHRPSGTTRHYDWNVPAGSVTVRTASGSQTIPAEDLDADASQAAIEAHRAFVNDRYWLLFPLHLVWDEDLRFEDRGVAPVPGLPGLGECRHLAVTWPESGGYTPGDRYLLYLGADDRPLAWSYHPGGAEEPRITTTREARHEVAGLSLPTRFETPDGAVFIAIEDLGAVTAGGP